MERDVYFLWSDDGGTDALTLICKAVVPINGVIMNIGAEHGLSTAALSHCAPHGFIFAFEADPSKFEVLLANCRQNNLRNVRTIPDAQDSLPVSLDGYIKLNRTHRMDFIRIAVDGNERRVLDGAMETIAKYGPTVQIQISAKSRSRDDLLEFVQHLLATFRHLFISDGGRVEHILQDTSLQATDRVMAWSSPFIDLVVTNNDHHAHALYAVSVQPQEPAPPPEPAVSAPARVSLRNRIARRAFRMLRPAR